MQSDWLSEGIPDGQFYHIRSCIPRCNAIQTDNATNHDVINCDNVTRMILSLVTIFCQNNNRRWSTRKDIGNWWQNYCSGLTLSFQQQGTFFWSNHSKLHSIYCWQLSLTSLSGRLKYVIKHQLRLERQRFFKAQCTAGNWTELNSTELFSSVQFSFPLCIKPATTCDDSATKSAVVAGSSQSGNICESANQRNVCRWTTTGDELRRLATAVVGSWLSRTCDGRLNSSPVQCTVENWTQLSWTIQFSWVQLSSVQFTAAHWA